MRYMMLVYSSQPNDQLDAAEMDELRHGHRMVIRAATKKGILGAAEPLAPITSATTVRGKDGDFLITDGPFAETKEHLAGYYILECENLDEAIDWAAKIPTKTRNCDGCIEIRPILKLRDEGNVTEAADPGSLL